jgi:hypothetical protein
VARLYRLDGVRFESGHCTLTRHDEHMEILAVDEIGNVRHWWEGAGRRGSESRDPEGSTEAAVSPGRCAIKGVPTSITAFVGRARDGPSERPLVVYSFSEFERLFGGLWNGSRLGFSVRDFFRNGGATAVIARTHATGGALSEAKRGLDLLDQADHINMLVMPPYETDDTVGPEVQKAAAAYCQRRRAMLLVDLPPTWDTMSAAEIAEGFGGSSVVAAVALARENVALYFPRLRQRNPLQGRVEGFAPSGAVAGVIARMDRQRGFWKAPAGPEAVLIGDSDLSAQFTEPEIGMLNRRGINCLRIVPGRRIIVWGSRTLATDNMLAPEWRYLAVRRTALYLEESVVRGTRWAEFEPNDATLWKNIRRDVAAFMNELFLQGAFQGHTPSESYYIKCDEETTTQADIDGGVVNILVGFAPIKRAEFVVLHVKQVAGRARSQASDGG